MIISSNKTIFSRQMDRKSFITYTKENIKWAGLKLYCLEHFKHNFQNNKYDYAGLSQMTPYSLTSEYMA